MMTTLSRSIAAAGALLAVALLAAACGDDAEALTKEEFIAQANEICETTNTDIQPIFDAIWEDLDDEFEGDEEAGEALLFQRFDDAMTEAMPFMDDQIAQLRALHPPEEDEEFLDELIDDVESAVDGFAEVAAAAADGDQAAMADMEDTGSAELAMNDANERATAYGLDDCGEE